MYTVPLKVVYSWHLTCMHTHSEKMELERKLGQSVTRADALAQEKKVLEANNTLLEETQRSLK